MILTNTIKNIFRSRPAAHAPNHRPKISILIPAYNHERFIEDTITSIWEQEYENLEIVAIDDVSSDGTFQILESLSSQSPIPMVASINDSNRGPAYTFNRAASMASGELFVLFSSDDMLASNRFERQVSILTRDLSVQILYGNGYGLDNESGRIVCATHTPETIELLQKSPADIYDQIIKHQRTIFMHTALIRRSLFEAVGGCDEAMLAEDWSLNIRIFNYLANHPEYKHVVSNDHVFYYRLHPDQNFRNEERQIESKWRIVERYTPEPFKFEASNNIILSHLNREWCILSDNDRARQLLRLARFHASLNQWSSALSLCHDIISLDAGNEEACQLSRIAHAEILNANMNANNAVAAENISSCNHV
ncbi:MAG: glycosyltransferase [Methylococcus sp.]|nr:glycosyltransferase [Methylococcus sp.]